MKAINILSADKKKLQEIMETINIITDLGVIDVYFGMNEASANDLSYPKSVFSLEFKNTKLLAVSFRNIYQFTINQERVDLTAPSVFLTRFNPYFDGDVFIFPELGVAAFGIDHPENGFEITAYSKSLSLYEKNLKNLPRYLELTAPRLVGEPFHIVPYQACGSFRLGATANEIIAAFGKPLRQAPRGSDGLVLVWEKIVAKFDKDHLVQITFENINDIFLEGENISKVGPTAAVFAGKEIFQNRAYQVLFDVGLAFSGFDKPREANTIIFFGESMKAIWSNTKRPLI